MKNYYALLFICCFQLISLKLIAQQKSFNFYRVPLYNGKPATLKLKGNKLAEQYRTIIKDTYYSTKEMVKWRHGATGLNFAGHYCFVYWGCGSECQDAAVVDLNTGVVYPAITASLGYDFKRSSRLVIVNPGQTINSCAFCVSEYWVWNDVRKRFIKLR